MPVYDCTPSGGGSTTTGVSSFNGRTGAVMPQAGDYTAAQVGAADATKTDQALKTLSDEVDGILAGTSPVQIPPASEVKVGGIKVGEGLSVTADGTLSADSQLPPNGTDGQLLGAGESGATNWVTTDTTPTESSANPVQSGGVFNALAGKADLTLSNLSNYQKALRNLGGRPSRNLLDNWYFAGGGSQQGGGQFPINQRGETSYTSPGYIIDRWEMNSGSVTLSADCIKITNANNKEALWWIRQFFEQNRFLVGTTLTVSALVKVSPSTPFTVVLQATQTTGVWSGSANAPKTGKYELVSYTTTLAGTPVGKAGFGLVTHSGANTGNADFIEVKALKVELGTTQTLAYQDEEGNWQLFETPDYGEELAKCQRYFQLYSTSENRPAKAVDCRPVMRTDPVQSTTVIGETTYYCNNAEL